MDGLNGDATKGKKMLEMYKKEHEDPMRVHQKLAHRCHARSHGPNQYFVRCIDPGKCNEKERR